MENFGNYLLVVFLIGGMACIAAPDVYWTLRKRSLRRRGWAPLDAFLRTNGLDQADLQKICKAGGFQVHLRGTPREKFIDGESAMRVLDGIDAFKQSSAVATKDNLQKAGFAAAGALLGIAAVNLSRSENSSKAESERQRDQWEKERNEKIHLVKVLSMPSGMKFEVWRTRFGGYLFENFEAIRDDPDSHYLYRRIFDTEFSSFHTRAAFDAAISGEPLDHNAGSELLVALLLAANPEEQVILLKPDRREPHSLHEEERHRSQARKSRSRSRIPERNQKRSSRADSKSGLDWPYTQTPYRASKRRHEEATRGIANDEGSIKKEDENVALPVPTITPHANEDEFANRNGTTKDEKGDGTNPLE
jgi:hypothetical protein